MSAPQIHHLFVSAGHNYFGHHGKPPGENQMLSRDRIECVAGRGVSGDRFFDHKPDYKGQITFFSFDALQQMWEDLNVAPDQREASATRRNVILGGGELEDWIGKEFTLQGVRFSGVEECRPCYWMNGAIHPEAEAWMAGRGGLRARILSSGFLCLGPV